MNNKAKLELAKYILNAIEVRDRSYRRLTFNHSISWRQAAEHVCKDKDLVDLVECLASCGLSEVQDWATRMQKNKRP